MLWFTPACPGTSTDVSDSDSKSTVLLALGANAGIAVAKLAAALVTGSSVLLAEAGHSIADTANELFLLASLRRGARAPDATHPFGYGKERFFWSLLAAVGIFVAGGLFSLYDGITSLVHPQTEEPSYLIGYIVLAVAMVLEGASLAKALRQTRGEARERGRTTWQHVRLSTDPTVKTVVSEDAAAVVGLLIAFTGLGLHELTGNARYDGAAAICVGLLLVVVAFLLGRDTKELLIGEATDPEQRLALYDALSAYPEVDSVIDLLTMMLGPNRMLVAVHLDLADGSDTSHVEDFSSRVESDLRERFPDIAGVFLDATRSAGPEAERAQHLADVMADRRSRQTGRVRP